MIPRSSLLAVFLAALMLTTATDLPAAEPAPVQMPAATLDDLFSDDR